ncbi:hypothetical protein H0H81_012311 [Sphagnurus paluster]|uniref:galacturonan 1,4-alpha-galacturonidase n=1 Tax=Sphagnurus paluster TaxID=117069 RepID=A0A9P7K873_9AGAR|nr:hypothetical protein H0H81_012311 [Sphagnurus paluster]
MLLQTSAVLVAHIYLVAAWQTFTVPHIDGQDDTPGLLAALGNYTTDSTILFEKGIKYNIFTPIKFPVLNNVEIRFEGNLTYPTDIPAIQGALKAYTLAFGLILLQLSLAHLSNDAVIQSFSGHWFSFAGGNNVTLRGSTDPNWGWIDAHGQAWWDTRNQVNRPHGFGFSKINGGVIRDMKLWKPIAWNFATAGSSNIHAFKNRIYALSENPDKAFPFNTDGFSAGGSNMLFEDNYIQNGDDCITVGNGAKNIHFRNSYCEGGHGLSIGSLGKNGQVADVQNILIENVVMKNSLYGARFKSWTGGAGLARNITWKNIAFTNVPFPIYITQNYWDQNLGPRPNSTSGTNTRVEDFRFESFAGIIDDRPDYFEGTCISDPCWYYVPGANGHEVAIFDLYPDTAKNIVTKHLLPITRSLKPATVMCDPKIISTDVGFKCWNGQFIPTKVGLF